MTKRSEGRSRFQAPSYPVGRASLAFVGSLWGSFLQYFSFRTLNVGFKTENLTGTFFPG